MSGYATGTGVPVSKSIQEIERVLTKYGASGFLYGWDELPEGRKAAVAFKHNGRHVRIRIPIPDQKHSDFTMTPTGRKRDEKAAYRTWDSEVKRRWRAMLLVIKAKLEAIEDGVATFDDEFLAYTVLPSGELVGEWFRPQLEVAYKTGKMPLALLPG